MIYILKTSSRRRKISNKEQMSEGQRGASSQAKFLIVSIILIALSSALFSTHPAFSKYKIGDITNSSSKYHAILQLPSLANSSIINASSLTGSPLSISKSMRNLNETTPEPGARPYIAENRNYIFSQNKTEISAPNNNSHTGEFGKGVKIAVVMPTFTAAAYNDAFYVFYKKYDNVSRGVNITKDLNLLSSKVTNEPSDSASG